MPFRRSPTDAASHNAAVPVFDRITLNVFMLVVTVAAAVLLGYGPAAAMHHIADVLAEAGSLPLPDETAWSGQLVF